jgi:hypothetical protein
MAASHDIQPLRRRRRPRPRPWRTIELNTRGWTALAAASLATAALLGGLTAALGGPVWVGAAVGLPLPSLVLLVLDRRRDGRRTTSFSWTDDRDEILRVAAELQQRGFAVSVSEPVDDNAASLLIPHRELRRVGTALRSLGLPAPR